MSIFHWKCDFISIKKIKAHTEHFIRMLVLIFQRLLFSYFYNTYYEISVFFFIYYSNDIFEVCFIAVRKGYNFASFTSSNCTGKAFLLLSALENDRSNFKRPALTMNHISESIIIGVFSKTCYPLFTSMRPSTQVSYLFSFIKRCIISQRFSRLFRLIM